MPDPITFTTEADRLNARDAAIALTIETWIALGDRPAPTDFQREQIAFAFDRLHPPITPPKMVSFEREALVNRVSGESTLTVWRHAPTDVDFEKWRIARVRVVEVDDE